jgi:hypothetical protein
LGLDVDNGGILDMDLASDQHTLYYLDQTAAIKRFDLSSSRQLPDFSSSLNSPSALRLLSSGALLVADGQTLMRLDASAKLVWSNTVPGISGWNSLRLAPGGASFWALGNSAVLAQLDLASGNLLRLLRADVTGNSVSLAVVGEPTAASGGAVLPSLAVALEGGRVVLSWSASATGFILETSPALGASANWQPVSVTPSTTNGQSSVSVPPNAQTSFYQLRKP